MQASTTSSLAGVRILFIEVLLLIKFSLVKERLQGMEVVMVEHVCATEYVAPTMGMWYARGMSVESWKSDPPVQL